VEEGRRVEGGSDFAEPAKTTSMSRERKTRMGNDGHGDEVRMGQNEEKKSENRS